MLPKYDDTVDVGDWQSKTVFAGYLDSGRERCHSQKLNNASVKTQ